ncbi:complement C1q-like protein 3 [Poecilia reticulata]|uniref:Complement C1q-like protein 3 n=1 Tax=Poecilia reticulata TaxID=8081 RepID=A0A3P9NNL2_POERE|nr:PREDICTED: complement C1q-like protein 3 [Poecilia reticulata]
MGFPSVMLLMCLVVGLTTCRAEGKDNQIQVTETTGGEQENHLTETAAEDTETLDQDLQTEPVEASNTGSPEKGCDPNIYMVLKELGALQERQEATVRALEETNRKLEASEKKVDVLNSTLTEMRRTYQEQHQVAFSAALPKDGTIGPVNVLYPLVYKHILSNIGGHYSPVTGYFTAPLRGLYYFSFSSLCWAGDGTSGGSLYRNENKVVSWYGYSKTDPISGSNSAILLLQAGDMVNIRLWDGRKISDNGNRYSTFSGFLLSPM